MCGSSNSPASDSGVTSSSTPLQLLGVGVGVGVTAPSCEQALLATGVPSTVHEVLGCVQMIFSASWVTFVSNPLAKPLFWAFSTVTVLPFQFPLPSLSLALSFLSSCPGFFWAAANAGCVAATAYIGGSSTIPTFSIH